MFKPNQAVIYRGKKQYVLRVLKNDKYAITHRHAGAISYQHANGFELQPCKLDTFHNDGSREVIYITEGRTCRVDFHCKTNDLGEYMITCSWRTKRVYKNLADFSERELLALFKVEFDLTLNEKRDATQLKVKTEGVKAIKKLDDAKAHAVLNRRIDRSTSFQLFLDYFNITKDEYEDLSNNVRGAMWQVLRRCIVYESIAREVGVHDFDRTQKIFLTE